MATHRRHERDRMNGAGPDVMVVGAGPTGLTTALAAHDHGARVRIIDRRHDTVRPSRALIVHPRTLEVLRPYGVTDALLDRADVAPTGRLHVGGREIEAVLGPFALDDTAFPYLTFVGQVGVEAVLAAALAERDVAIEWGTELVDVSAGPDGVDVVVRTDGGLDRFTAGHVVGCDGSSSTVRELAGAGWHSLSYPVEAVLADVELDGALEEGVAHVAPGRDGLVFVFALGERATWRILATRAATPTADGRGRDPATAGEVRPAELQALLDRAGLGARVVSVAWSERVRLRRGIARRYRAGPLFLAGDAAHVHSPAGGLGMNTGIGDAANLGWKVALSARHPAATGADDALLGSYERERRPAAQQVLALTHTLFWGEASTDPFARALRTDLVPLVAPLVPHLLARRRLTAAGIRHLSRLRVHHRQSPLSVDHGPRCGRLRAGDRLGDAPVVVDGRPRRLHELCATPGFHVLLDRDAPPIDPGPDPLVQVHRRQESAGSGCLVVRPDGHVGLRSGDVDPVAIAGWFHLVGIERPPGDRAALSRSPSPARTGGPGSAPAT
ncbi:MAG: FAD-dependent monooxygenase [Actinomycetota bacterium]|nr:FAD-dependent monooxygenase [Actinomycetota bacterium]